MLLRRKAMQRYSATQISGISRGNGYFAGRFSSCEQENLDPYRLESIFVVPSGATDALALKLEVFDELPRFLQLTL